MLEKVQELRQQVPSLTFHPSKPKCPAVLDFQPILKTLHYSLVQLSDHSLPNTIQYQLQKQCFVAEPGIHNDLFCLSVFPLYDMKIVFAALDMNFVVAVIPGRMAVVLRRTVAVLAGCSL